MAQTQEILGQFLGDESFPVSWDAEVVLFTRIAGLVTDTGGTTSHPAVLAREFGIPAVIGTSVATQRIVTGDWLRIDGTVGRVEILRSEPGSPVGAPGSRGDA